MGHWQGQGDPLFLNSSVVSTEEEFPENFSRNVFIWAFRIAIRETQTQVET